MVRAWRAVILILARRWRAVLLVAGIALLVGGWWMAERGTAQPARPMPKSAEITVLARPHSTVVRVAANVSANGSFEIAVLGPRPNAVADAAVKDLPDVAIVLLGDARLVQPNVSMGQVQVFPDVDCLAVAFMLSRAPGPSTSTGCSSPAQVLVFDQPQLFSELLAEEEEFDCCEASFREIEGVGDVYLYGIVEGSPTGDFVAREGDRWSVTTPQVQLAKQFVEVETDFPPEGDPMTDERVVTAINLPQATEDRTGTQFGPPDVTLTELSVRVAAEEQQLRIDYAEPAFDTPSVRGWGSCASDDVCPQALDPVQLVAPGSVEMSKPGAASKASFLLIMSGVVLSLGSQAVLEVGVDKIKTTASPRQPSTTPGTTDATSERRHRRMVAAQRERRRRRFQGH